jgi:hypothetical protein
VPTQSTMENPRPRLGRLLVDKGLIGEDELAEALRVHEQTGKQLGEIVTEHLRLVSVPTLADLLLLQQRWRPLGEMLVEDGILSEERLLEALDEQAETGRPLGEIVAARFHVSAQLLDALLQRQRELEIELEQGYASGLRSALRARSDAAKRAGEPRDPALAPRIALAESGWDDPKFHLALKAVEQRDGKIGSMRELVERQRAELDRLRDALHERQLTVIELEERVAELEAVVAATSG